MPLEPRPREVLNVQRHLHIGGKVVRCTTPRATCTWCRGLRAVCALLEANAPPDVPRTRRWALSRARRCRRPATRGTAAACPAGARGTSIAAPHHITTALRPGTLHARRIRTVPSSFLHLRLSPTRSSPRLPTFLQKSQTMSGRASSVREHSTHHPCAWQHPCTPGKLLRGPRTRAPGPPNAFALSMQAMIEMVLVRSRGPPFTRSKSFAHQTNPAPQWPPSQRLEQAHPLAAAWYAVLVRLSTPFRAPDRGSAAEGAAAAGSQSAGKVSNQRLGSGEWCCPGRRGGLCRVAGTGCGGPQRWDCCWWAVRAVCVLLCFVNLRAAAVLAWSRFCSVMR